MQEKSLELRGQRVRCIEGGRGPTLLYLHGFGGLAEAPLLDRLCAGFHVLAPEHPGFGQNVLPDWLQSAGDLAFFYLDLLDALDLRAVHLAGHAVGGWIAAELAIRSTTRLASLTLLAPAGVVVPDVSIADIFLAGRDELLQRQVFDPTAEAAAAFLARERAVPLEFVLQNRAALARIGWSPRLHNPQLPYWLHRIDVPTLLVWGRNDRIVPFACHRPWCEAIPRAELFALDRTGHALHIERAAEIAGRMQDFVLGVPA
jgi:pimeloyl-ACP methyl ester carboxylesterase